MSAANEMLAQNHFCKITDLASRVAMKKNISAIHLMAISAAKKSNLIGEDILACVERNLT